MLASGEQNAVEAVAYRLVAEHVVGTGGFLDEPGGEGFEPAHALDGLVHFPYLVRIDHEPDIVADGFAGDAAPANIVLNVLAHLDLDVPESL